jgi:Fe(3+) dicitrate transport protein
MIDRVIAFIQAAARVAIDPLTYLFDPSRRIYGVFIATSVLLAAAHYILRRRRFRGLVGYLFSPRLWWARSAQLDYKLFLSGGIIRKLLFAPVVGATLGGSMAWAATLQLVLGAPPAARWSNTAVAIVYTASLFVVDDVSRYLLHRAMHRVPGLWELHKVHHSAEVLTPLTLYRVHPLESLLSAVRAAAVTAFLVGGFFYLFRGQLSLIELFGVNAIGVVLTAAGSNLRHSHVPVSFGERVEHLLISPLQHQIHHSAAVAHRDKNFGSLLAIWDWIGGTLLCASELESERLRFGLARGEKNHVLSLGSAYLDPLRRIVRGRRVRPFAVATIAGLACVFLAFRVAAEPGDAEPANAPQAGAPAVDRAAVDRAAVDRAAVDRAAVDRAAVDRAAVDPKPYELGAMSVFGRGAEAARITGSAHVIDEAALKQFEDDDPHRVLARVPGVYVRGEDGYGLRPNIGMRGAISDRSKKVSLLEDGILLGPAPYSAPAAYYFPLLTRMTGLEVFKGPAAIQHGPQTIGGAINLISRPVPASGHRLATDMAYGADAYGKWHGYYGYGSDRAGVLIEAVRLRSDGFKRLAVPPGVVSDTGFERTEVVAKARLGSSPDARVFHEARVKFGFSHEHSNETYLGLSDADFAVAPVARYAASQLDRMRNHRLLAEAGYRLAIAKRLDLDIAVYHHRFTRSWFKVAGFRGGPSITAVLADPSGGKRQVFYDVLTGAQDSATSDEVLELGDNHRRYLSQGVQLTGWLDLPSLGPVVQRARLGLRYHYDQVRRRHTVDGFDMRSGRLVSEGRPQQLTTRNLGDAHAIAGYVADELQLGDLTLVPGLRVEHIRTGFDDHETGVTLRQVQQVVLPGVGGLYAIAGGLSAVAGVYQGFSPVAPGDGDVARPELSVNYEAGLRLLRGELQAEAVGFYNDYSNITGQCSFSSGCAAEQLDQQFDGGEARIAGLEASLQHRIAISGLNVPLRASYTYTRTELLTNFSSDNPLFGEVEAGDEMPYIPRHQAALLAGLHMEHGGFNLGGSYMAAMREAAGDEPLGEVMSTDAFLVLDALAYVRPVPQVEVYLKIDNLLDDVHTVSHRPYGARPGRPRFVQLGLRTEM